MILAAYLRDSGGDRQENSTDRQLAEIQSWAARTGHTIALDRTDRIILGEITFYYPPQVKKKKLCL